MLLFLHEIIVKTKTAGIKKMGAKRILGDFIGLGVNEIDKSNIKIKKFKD
jgi:hypothetical protein